MVKEYKVKFVRELAGKLKSAKTLGIADIGRLPSRQMQEVRRGLRGKAEVLMIKRALLKRALEEAGLNEMAEHIARSPVVIIGDEDAFSIFRVLKNLRSPSKAKPGMVASEDITVRKGGTGLPPGPAIGDLQSAGIPAKIEGGQIRVIKDHVVTKAGEEVTQKVAAALDKLDMKPFMLGLETTAILEGGIIFKRDVLDVDIDKIMGQIGQASSNAFSLAYATGHPVKEVVEMRLRDASGEGLSLALNTDWVSEDTIRQILSKASAHALSLNNTIGGG